MDCFVVGMCYEVVEEYGEDGVAIFVCCVVLDAVFHNVLLLRSD